MTSHSWQKASSPSLPLVVALLIFLSLSAAGVWAWTSALSAVHDVGTFSIPTAAAPSHFVAQSDSVPPYTEPYRSALVSQATPPAVYLYASPTTARYLTSIGLRQSDILKPWQDHLLSRGRIATETDSLAEVPGTVFSVLIIPSAIALDAVERIQISRLHAAGVSILVTWAAGVRDGEGNWAGYHFLNELLGIRVHGHIARDSDAQFLNLQGETPLTIGYPAGRRIWLGNTTGALLRVSGRQSAAKIMDWQRSGRRQDNAAVLFDTRGPDRHGARWAYFAFPESAWASEHEAISGLLDNTLHWLGHGTAASVATWPLPYQAAYMLEMDTEEGFETAYAFGQMMDEVNMPATFYILTSEGLRYPRLVRHLARRHEIAYHGDDHSSFLNMSEDGQRARFGKMREQMQTLLHDTTRVGGFRAPYEQYDVITEQLLQEYRFNHHASRPGSTDAMLPYFQNTGGGLPGERPVVLPRTQSDDLNLQAGDTRAGSAARMQNDMLADFETAVEFGGMGLLSIHSQYFWDGSPLQTAMRGFLGQVGKKRGTVWFAGGSEIALWWQERARVRLQSHGMEQGMRLEIDISGQGPLSRGAIILTNFRPDSVPTVKPTSPGMLAPAMVALDRYRSAIVLDGYFPGQYTFTVKAAPESLPHSAS